VLGEALAGLARRPFSSKPLQRRIYDAILWITTAFELEFCEKVVENASVDFSLFSKGKRADGAQCIHRRFSHL
jgi:hypothetical protein